MTAPEVVVDNNSRLGACCEIAKIGLASRLASAQSLQIRPNKLPKNAIMGVSVYKFGNKFEIAWKMSMSDLGPPWFEAWATIRTAGRSTAFCFRG